MRKIAALLVALPAAAMASWQNTIATDGQVDAFGIAFFFYLFFCYVNINDGYKESVAKGRKCVLGCTAFGLAALFIPFVRWIVVVVFLVSFVQFAWKSLK
ncbi:hypothetical protein [Pantoea sp. 18069]|uniref:hypothetical protein n=1 Tax=Pantoea sp. 18069 TaxID=2681415 RepID=UPI00135C2E6F|nr:hypothetical protein [Pantoea sp. 18069]